jgi:putative CocE/NonD family hydrolase
MSERNVVVERDCEIAMPDGVVLRADVYRAAEIEPSPVLVQCTAYNKANWLSVYGVINPMRAVASGFVVVVADVRNRFRSGGDEPFEPFVADGEVADTVVTWAAAQPWSNGRVGMYGASNNGVPQWQGAKRRPPALCAIAPHFTASEYDEGWVYRGGAFQLGFNAWWSLVNLAPDMLARARGRGASTSDADAYIGAAQRDERVVFGREPRDALGPVTEHVPHYERWLRHGPGDPFWDATSLSKVWGQIDLPILHIAGWYNVHLDGNLANFVAMRTHGPERVRDHQHLVIGPWTQWQPAVGDACGPEQRYPTALFDMEGLQLSWFAHHLTGAPEPPLARARVFLMGTGEWRDFAEWPPAEAIDTPFHLASDGGANSQHDGVLAHRPGEDAGSGASWDELVHDAGNPVPTVGGATMLPHYTASAGQRDQRVVEDRVDVLVYSTPPLDEDLTLVGPVVARLWVSASSPTFDVAAKLCDVHPDGGAMILCDGITRVGEIVEPASPGEPTLIEVDLIATANVFRAGHRVRLEIAGSNYPKFDLHARRSAPGEIAETVTEPIPVRVWHDGEHPSVLVLPVLP